MSELLAVTLTQLNQADGAAVLTLLGVLLVGLAAARSIARHAPVLRRPADWPITEPVRTTPPIGVVRVWQINEGEWWASTQTTPEAVLDEYMQALSCTRAEALDSPDALPEAMTPEQMERLRFLDEDGNSHSFAEELRRNIVKGMATPYVFAVEDF